jgi:hypothetical protein
MASSEDQKTNPATRARGSGGDLQSKSLSIPDTKEAESRQEPAREDPQETSDRVRSQESEDLR